MNRIETTLTRVANRVAMAAPFALAFAYLTLGSANLAAGPQCYGGSEIKNSAGVIVGCAFNQWGTAEQNMCVGSVVFSGPDPKNCHICVISPYDAQVANDNFTGLSLVPVPYPNQTPPPPTTFRCLKCAQPPVGLTAWWTLDENSGTVHDVTGNLSLDGIRYGAISVAGEVGNAMHFNGSKQYVEIPNDNQLNVDSAISTWTTGDFSIDAWVKLDPATTTSGVRVIVEKRSFTAPNHYKGYSFYLYNRYLGVQLADDGYAPGYSNYGAPTLVVPADGNWHFVAVSVARGSFSVQFTLDDKPAVSVYSPGRSGDFSTTAPLRIGMGNINNGSDAFNGSIDEVEFFHRAVTPAEWQSIYSAKCYGKCPIN